MLVNWLTAPKVPPAFRRMLASNSVPSANRAKATPAPAPTATASSRVEARDRLAAATPPSSTARTGIATKAK